MSREALGAERCAACMVHVVYLICDTLRGADRLGGVIVVLVWHHAPSVQGRGA